MDMKLIFPMSRRIYAIPYWVASVIRRNNMKMEELLDFKKASAVLSQNDLVDLLCFHQIGKDLFPTRPHQHDNPLGQWWFTDAETKESIKASHGLECKLALEPARFDEVKCRLYSEEASSRTDVAISNSDPACGFEVVALRDQALGIILYNGIRKAADVRETEFQLLRSVAKQLYVYEQPTKVAESFVYGLYLRTLLRRKTAMA